jgi:hypothetical protein
VDNEVLDVICEVAYLTRDRPQEIRERLKKVSGGYVNVPYRPLADRFEIKAGDGEPPRGNWRGYMFHSTIESVVCQYGEFWEPVGANAQEFRFQSVYFQLLQHRERLGEDPREIVAFHWHLSGIEGHGTGRYGDRPHVHLTSAPEPLPRSHLGVTLTVGADHQATIPYLNQLLDDAIGMVEAEVLGRLGTTPLAWL